MTEPLVLLPSLVLPVLVDGHLFDKPFDLPKFLFYPLSVNIHHGAARLVGEPQPTVQTIEIVEAFRALVSTVSTTLRWRARPDDGEHSGG